MGSFFVWLAIAGFIIRAVLRSNKRKQDERERQYRQIREQNGLPDDAERLATPPATETKSQASEAVQDMTELAQDIFAEFMGQIRSAKPGPDGKATYAGRSINARERQKLEAYRARRTAQANGAPLPMLAQQAIAANEGEYESGEGQEFHTDFGHSNSGLSDRGRYTGSLPPPDWTLEGECEPSHLHTNSPLAAATVYEGQARRSGMSVEAMRQAVVWSEILKRPRPGVAPRYR